jgi:hypothetical protein
VDGLVVIPGLLDAEVRVGRFRRDVGLVVVAPAVVRVGHDRGRVVDVVDHLAQAVAGVAAAAGAVDQLVAAGAVLVLSDTLRSAGLARAHGRGGLDDVPAVEDLARWSR